MDDSKIIAIDQGTSGTKAIIFNNKGEIQARASVPLKSYYPLTGYVEQEPEEIYQNVIDSVKVCLKTFRDSGGSINKIITCGISNQRETFLLWNKEGRPLTNAILWQCKRSVDICTRLASNEVLRKEISDRTGLIIDPYFSGTKLLWLTENDVKIHLTIERGQAYFGTIDTWLLHKLTKGQVFATDYTNASRTLLFNIHSLKWDDYLVEQFGLSNLNLPKVEASSFDYGETDFEGLLDQPIRIGSLIGDSHAAAFGEGCFVAGTAKATLGTGCSILMNIGEKPIRAENGMLTTICWSTEDRVDYALEGTIVSCGATIQWIIEQLQLVNDISELEKQASEVDGNNGVYVIPAFSGLGAPYWDMNRKASIEGLTFDTHKGHILRAALESIPYQIKDVIVAMEEASGISLSELFADGGITTNKFVMQFLADLLGIDVISIKFPDVSALGAAYLAGLNQGMFRGLEHVKKLITDRDFYQMGSDGIKARDAYLDWKIYIQGYLGNEKNI